MTNPEPIAEVLARVVPTLTLEPDQTVTPRRRPYNWRIITALRTALAQTQAELSEVREALEQVSAENDTLRIQNANQADLRAALTDEHPVMTPRSRTLWGMTPPELIWSLLLLLVAFGLTAFVAGARYAQGVTP